jgi:hypothetical protein
MQETSGIGVSQEKYFMYQRFVGENPAGTKLDTMKV